MESSDIPISIVRLWHFGKSMSIIVRTLSDKLPARCDYSFLLDDYLSRWNAVTSRFPW